MANRPRWIKGASSYSEVQRTVDRTYLFKPDDEVRQIIGAAAGRALAKFPVKIYWMDFSINHKHCGVGPMSDADEHIQNYSKFHQMFNSLVAKGLNKYLEREGAVYSTRNRSTEVLDNTSLEQQLFYAVTNVVKDGLVDRVAEWNGFSSYNQLATGEVEKFYYIDYAAWKEAGGPSSGKKPHAFLKTTTVKLTPLPQWEKWSEDKRQSHFRREVRNIEQKCRDERAAAKNGVVGIIKLQKLDHRDRPKTKPTRTPQPLCHCSSRERAKAFRNEFRAFLDQFYEASDQWMSGAYTVEFPRGSFKPPLPVANT